MKSSSLNILLKICLLITLTLTLTAIFRMTLAIINNQFNIDYIFYLIVHLICSFICYMNYRYFKKEF